MQRWELSALDGKHLAPVSVPRPGPGPGEALVAVDAVSLNYRDNLIMANRLGAEPPPQSVALLWKTAWVKSGWRLPRPSWRSSE